MPNTTNELTIAKLRKKDEFYTTYEDIAKEIPIYGDYFKGKTVFLPCDDYQISQFFQYFKDNFYSLGIKKLISIGYKYGKNSEEIEYDGSDIKITSLSGNGDFRNQESCKIMQESDVVVTNPPFSLFTKLLEQIFSFQKDFLLIGSTNAFTSEIV